MNELILAWLFLSGALFSVIFIGIFDHLTQKQFHKHFSRDKTVKGNNKNITVKVERLK